MKARDPNRFLSEVEADEKERELLRGVLGEPNDSAPSASGLLSQVDRLPLCYAPFFPQLAELFAWSEDRVEQSLSEMAEPRFWKLTPVPGVRIHVVEPGARLEGATTQFVRFSPGTRFPRHRHREEESVLVMEGYYADDSGKRVGPGDMHNMPAGSTHGFRVGKEGACIAASLHRGFDFLSWPLQMLKKIGGQ